MKNRLRLEGDHSGEHCGCTAVFSALRTIATGKGWTLSKKGEDYDVLVVNGEGTMHRGRKGWHSKMTLLRAALDAGKPAYLVNSVWQENPNDYDDVLRGLSGITVREVNSQADLMERHGIISRVVADVSMVAGLPRRVFFARDFKGRPVKTDFFWPDSHGFGKARRGLFPSADYLSLQGVSWGRAVASLKTASYLITGRQHGVYLACRARIPFVASEGNTHKIRGLIRSAGVEIPVADTPEQIREIVPILPDLREEYEKLFSWLDRQHYTSVIPPRLH